MADDDNFDIDIYGEDETDEVTGTMSAIGNESNNSAPLDDRKEALDNDHMININESNLEQRNADSTGMNEGSPSSEMEDQQQIQSTDADVLASVGAPAPTYAPSQQGVKRKEGPDDRVLEAGASSAFTIHELQWWETEDDIRGWANRAGCEDELIDITFSEHKVNGKSKGQAYVEFRSPQAATATKQKIQKFAEGQPTLRKHVVHYSNSMNNPFKTLPKDAPKGQSNTAGGRAGSGNFNGAQNNFNTGSNFRGRGGMNNRGGMNSFRGNFNGGPNSNPMQSGGFGQIGNVNNSNRGGMVMNGAGMRGSGRGVGRGGMNMMNMMNNMPMVGMNGLNGMGGMGGMGMMPNYGMAMGGMGNMGNMGNMGMGMGMGGFGGSPQGHFNPAFFQQSQMGSQGNSAEGWNPHGAKRPRPE